MLAARVDESGREGSSDVLAAIDIGTNSVHMVIARIAANDRFEVVTRQKEMVRLGSGQGEMKHLEADAIDRGVAALREACRRIQAPVLAVQGRQDPYGTLQQLEDIRPDSGLIDRCILDHCGHSPHRDQTQACTDRIVSFLSHCV